MGWGERAFLTRWQLALIVLLLFAAVGTSIAFGIAAVRASHRASEASRRVAVVQRDQQANRIVAIEQLCEHDNANAQHNIDFLRFDVHADKRLVAKARARFRLTPDCHAFAVKAVRSKP